MLDVVQPKVRAVPPGQLVRPFRDFKSVGIHTAKRRIKNQPLPCCGQVQHLAERVQKVAIRNPALQAICWPGLDDLARLAYAIAPRVWYIKIPELQALGDGLPAQAW